MRSNFLTFYKFDLDFMAIQVSSTRLTVCLLRFKWMRKPCCQLCVSKTICKLAVLNWFFRRVQIVNSTIFDQLSTQLQQKSDAVVTNCLKRSLNWMTCFLKSWRTFANNAWGEVYATNNKHKFLLIYHRINLVNPFLFTTGL